MIEAGVVVSGEGPAFWHLPQGRSGGSLPDSRELWDVLWDLRKEVLLGFAHSHPGSGLPGPSHTDLTTFAAIEAGLGRRLDWWITSSDFAIHLRWIGPDKFDYGQTVVPDPSWAARLRDLSREGVQQP